MKVSFRTRYRDLIAFNFYFTFRSPIAYGLLFILIVLTIKPNWQAAMNRSADRSLAYQFVLFTILELFPVICVLLLITLGLLVANISKMNKTILTDATIALEDDFIFMESAYARMELQWTAVQKLVRTRSYIFLFVAQYAAYAIPKRVFESDDAFDQFWATCQAKAKT